MSEMELWYFYYRNFLQNLHLGIMLMTLTKHLGIVMFIVKKVTVVDLVTSTAAFAFNSKKQ